MIISGYTWQKYPLGSLAFGLPSLHSGNPNTTDPLGYLARIPLAIKYDQCICIIIHFSAQIFTKYHSVFGAKEHWPQGVFGKNFWKTYRIPKFSLKSVLNPNILVRYDDLWVYWAKYPSGSVQFGLPSLHSGNPNSTYPLGYLDPNTPRHQIGPVYLY